MQRSEIDRQSVLFKTPNVKWTAYAPPILPTRHPSCAGQLSQAIAWVGKNHVFDVLAPG
jgi:hypothetical protein